MRVILSGGGTGGHIYPALAIAEELKDRLDQIEILYVGKKDSLEEELASKAGLDFASIRAKGLPRKKINRDSVSSLVELIKGLGDAGKILNNFNPDIVIGTGGYVCAPILLKAQGKKIPTMIQEQNAYPGKANRLIAKKADLVALSFDEAKKYFPENAPIFFTGNPIRKEFRNLDKNVALKKLGFKEKKIILSLGGSGGQESTNEAVLEMMKQHPNIPFHLIHITGKAHYDDFMAKLPSEYNEEKYTILDYSHDIPDLMQVATAVIASSSAMTLAEISATAKASILIPKAYTAGNHQWHNAKSYESKGAALVIEEKDLDGTNLYKAINLLLEDREKRNTMEEATLKLANGLAVSKIVDEVIKLGYHGK